MFSPIKCTCCTRGVQENGAIGLVVHKSAEILCSADWYTTKPIAPFSCTQCVQQVHSKAEVIHLTPAIPGLLLLFNSHA